MKNKLYTFDQDIKKRLKDPEFKKAWEKSEIPNKRTLAIMKQAEEAVAWLEKQDG